MISSSLWEFDFDSWLNFQRFLNLLSLWSPESINSWDEVVLILPKVFLLPCDRCWTLKHLTFLTLLHFSGITQCSAKLTGRSSIFTTVWIFGLSDGKNFVQDSTKISIVGHESLPRSVKGRGTRPSRTSLSGSELVWVFWWDANHGTNSVTSSCT